jgi:hypothetical protein
MALFGYQGSEFYGEYSSLGRGPKMASEKLGLIFGVSYGAHPAQ